MSTWFWKLQVRRMQPTVRTWLYISCTQARQHRLPVLLNKPIHTKCSVLHAPRLQAHLAGRSAPNRL